MKQYVERRSEWIDRAFLTDASLPATPVIAPANTFDFDSTALQRQLISPTSPQKVRWRLAEITDPKTAATRAKQHGKYEINAIWEAEGGATAEIPTKKLKKGRTYRIRARVQDGKGRWSHWSAPDQFSVSR